MRRESESRHSSGYQNRHRPNFDKRRGFNRHSSSDRGGGNSFFNTPVDIPSSVFQLPENPTLGFQRAIGMTKGKILEFHPKKPKGVIEVDGFQYKFEDNRKPLMMKRFPLNKFIGREIIFSFWPTFSEKAAQYLKPDDPPRIKIANLRKNLEHPNEIEAIGQVVVKESNYFIISIFSQSQRKKYLVTFQGHYPGRKSDFAQVMGELKGGLIYYTSHHVLHTNG